MPRLAFRRRAVGGRRGVPIGCGGGVGRPRLWDAHAADGTGARYDGLVVATGLRSRRLHVPGPVAGRHTLRTVEDCLALRTALDPGAGWWSSGAGFIGSETACSLAGLGHHVTVVEPTGPPMNQAIGPELAAAVQRHHEAAGIEFVIGRVWPGSMGRRRSTPETPSTRRSTSPASA